MKKLITIMTLILSAQTFCYDLLKLPFQVYSDNEHLAFEAFYGLSDEIAKGDNPLMLVLGIIATPFVLLDEETDQMVLSMDALLEQDFSATEIDQALKELNQYAKDNQNTVFTNKADFEASIRAGVQSSVALEILGIH